MMKLSGTTVTALTVASLAALPLMGVRGAFATPYTSQVRASINAVDQRIGDVKVADAYVLAPAHGVPSLHLALQEAPHTPADLLKGVWVDTSTGAKVSPAGLPTQLAPGQVINHTWTGLPLPTTSDWLPIPGATVTVTMAFANAGTVRLHVPVIALQP